jgi:hypothetical protein
LDFCPPSFWLAAAARPWLKTLSPSSCQQPGGKRLSDCLSP